MFLPSEQRQSWLLRPALPETAGAGHSARCIALGAELADRAEATIVLSEGSVHANRARSAGVLVAAEMEKGRRWDGIILDDYSFDAATVAAAKACSSVVVQFDDLGAPLSCVDLAINASPGLTGTRLGAVAALLGPAYACLQRNFSEDPPITIRPDVERVVVAMGWVDTREATGFVLRDLVASGLGVDVILGPDAAGLSSVDGLCRKTHGWSLHIAPRDPTAIARRADIAICAGGQTLLERFAAGIPVIAIEVADNQRFALAGSVREGAVVALGRLDTLELGAVGATVKSLSNDHNARVGACGSRAAACRRGRRATGG